MTSTNEAEVVRRHGSLVWLGRSGWVAKGVVYAVVGLLALAVAVGSDRGGGGSGDASQRGAIERIADSPGGATALWALATGLVLYAAWRLVSAVLPGDDDAGALLERIGWVGSAVLYLGLAFLAVSMATGARSAGGGGEEPLVEQLSSDLIATGWGRWLVAIAGLGAIGVGIYFAVKGWTDEFADRLEPGGVGPLREAHLRALGTIGWIARGAVVAVVGAFLVVAALQADPQDANGLDSSLDELARSTWGAVIVAAIGTGLVACGAFAAVSAPKRRLSGP